MILKKILISFLPILITLACGQVTSDSTVGIRGLPSTTRVVPKITLTKTQTSNPTSTETIVTELCFTFKYNTNCRQGPSQIYGIITIVPQGNSAEIIGRNEKNSWLLISLEDESISCWVSIITGTLEEKRSGNIPNVTETKFANAPENINLLLSPMPIMPTLTPWPDSIDNPDDPFDQLNYPDVPTKTPFTTDIKPPTPIPPNPLTPPSFPTQVLP